MAKHGYYAQGGRSAFTPKRDSEWEPYVDKDPFYRTMDILNGAYKKKPAIRLEAGDRNSTNLKTVWVNFGETLRSMIIEKLGPGRDAQHELYKLACGHEWEGKSGHIIKQDYGHCWVCGADQAYYGFEHEWQHIIFKSDLAHRALFIENYTKNLQQSMPSLNGSKLIDFLALLTNAFDDIRCNSLWEKIYPGSAAEIWKRWKRLTLERGDDINTIFLDFIFAVAFNIPTDPNGEFEPLRPVIEWGVYKVKYRGFMNMLVDLRTVIDHCVGAMISQFQKQPAPQGERPDAPGQEPKPGDPIGGKGEDNQPNYGGTGDPDKGGEREPSPISDTPEEEQVTGQDHENGHEGGEQEEKPSLDQIPSASNIQGKEQEKANALNKLMVGGHKLDDQEEHKDPDQEQLANARASHGTMAALRKILQIDVSDIDAIEQMLPDDVIDHDMAQAITQIMNGVAQKSVDSQLTGNAKSKILLINVTTDGVKPDSKNKLSDEEEIHVKRMRAAFFKALGRQKAKRSSEGSIIDVPALIKYRLDRQDPDVFENEAVQQGFAYSILCDMSGSMQSTFPNVCHAVEMLKQALHFPFVAGNMWGFRGGQTVSSRDMPKGEVWIYRYGKEVEGYTGFQRVNTYKSAVVVPVGCGGNTPMNPAINVVVSHLWKKVSPGMSKNLFILTDGSPCSERVTGSPLSEKTLRKFVAKEINMARKHGIRVYTLVIGNNSISDEQCREMFGMPRFWKRVKEREQVGGALAQLVLDNFQKYIKARG